ncbi:hypothetical protein [Pseudescherichia sp.]|uniref:hypothetical protein n=1 Tax=Pseudescherichia sp. TaxID=2055881 RepID=UPI00289E5C0B|nr:hypothetical protein [Pseudescherichia sp.]
MASSTDMWRYSITVSPGSYLIANQSSGSMFCYGLIWFKHAFTGIKYSCIMQGDKLWAYGDVTVIGNASGQCDVQSD